MSAEVLSACEQATVVATRREQWEILRTATGTAALLGLAFGLHDTLLAFPGPRFDSGLVVVIGLLLLLAPLVGIRSRCATRRQQVVAAVCLLPAYSLLLHSSFCLDAFVLRVGGTAGVAVDFLYTASLGAAVCLLLAGGVSAGISLLRFPGDRRMGPRRGVSPGAPAQDRSVMWLGPFGWLTYLVLLRAVLTPHGTDSRLGFPFPVATGFQDMLEVSAIGLLVDAGLCYGALVLASVVWRRVRAVSPRARHP